MTDNEYQELAIRTCVDSKELSLTPYQHDLLHGVLGLQDEVGELANQVKKTLIYQKELDVTNIQEELGDCMWIIAMLHGRLGLDMNETKRKNLAKLRVRYPNKFSVSDFDNRDLSSERTALES